LEQPLRHCLVQLLSRRRRQFIFLVTGYFDVIRA